MDSTALTTEIKEKSKELGFDLCRIAPIDVDIDQVFLRKWLDNGYAATMNWLHRNFDKRVKPQLIMEEAKTIIMFGVNYYQERPDRRGTMAMYALGRDYHKVLNRNLKAMGRFIESRGGKAKWYVDTGPVMERSIAEKAGLGWKGKSSHLINRDYGTWLFLSEVFTDLELVHDTESKNYCGSCTSCIDVCPTQAIVAPYELDSRKCIAYLTIEHHGSIPEEFRRAIGDHVFGCDDCLDVCPWNRWAKQTKEADFDAKDLPDLRDMLKWNHDEFFNHFAGTPIYRLKLDRWKRNICVVLGNIGTTDDLLDLNLVKQENDLIGEHAQWAITEIERRLG
mgnify:CR=1 FL=1